MVKLRSIKTVFLSSRCNQCSQVSTLTFKAFIIFFEIKINGTKKFGNGKKSFYKCVFSFIHIRVVYENYLEIVMHRINHSIVFKETSFIFWEQ